jgi:hypothetical protein
MKIEVRRVGDAAHLVLAGETAAEWRALREFVELINGGPVDPTDVDVNPVFDRSLRVESVGFDDDGIVESLTVEGDTWGPKR